MVTSSTQPASRPDDDAGRPPDQPHGNAAFGRATPLVARVGRALFVALVLAVPAYIAGIAWEVRAAGAAGGAAVHIDFVAFWAAAKLAVAGQAAAAFDPATLVAHQSLADPEAWGTYYWHYPALFHLMVTPLGLLPFTPAFAVFSALALGLYIWAVHGWARPVPGGLALAVASPPVAFVLATGNATLIWAAGFLCALALLASGRALAAGAVIALLTFKPQLGILIPVALIAGRHWRAFAWATLATLAVTALSFGVLGLDYLAAFLRGSAETADLLDRYGENAKTMVTWYALSRQLGAGAGPALAVQALSLAAAVAAVALVWRRPATFDLRVAVLCLATLVATPYAFQYELVLAVVAALFLARAGVGAHAGGRAWLAALWLLPVPGWLIPGLEIAHYAAPVLTLSAAAATGLALRQKAAAAPA